ncbi:hypothetical protein K4K49_008288 [Colletotrichum sp. SAR 10_70]|nr:hypothetical protein K4K50_007968 [Colletotrichum sp. SAR 10_71]KAI8157780.1 hypothetical protein K4K49_008288 [Colletotrichum sp. SAR 10_70]KAI8229580.1 hypothetical protein K4K54_001444 [Colletotrichum sp. SAR 10_86]
MAVVDEETNMSKTSTRSVAQGNSDAPPQNALMATISRTRSRTNTILEKVSLRERIHHFTFAWYTLT